MVLCGGRGSRLQPAISELPKPLVPIHGKPILQHIIEFYLAKAFCEMVLCVGHQADRIRAFVAAQRFPAQIHISDAGTDAGMLRRLYEARSFIGDRTMVTYGDTFIDLNVDHMLQEHLRQETAATITIADIRNPFGIVQVGVDQRVVAFQEKPLLPYYIGHLVMERRVLDTLDERLLALPDGEGLVCLFQQLIQQRQLGSYKHTGLQITFNTLAERDRAEQELMKFFTEGTSR